MNFNKIYVISDIHGHIEGLIEAQKVASKECPLFILGDLFDNIYGYELQIIDLIIKLYSQNRCYIIMGNHDEVTLLLLFRFMSDETILKEFNNPGFTVITKVYKYLMDEEYYHSLEKYRQQLIVDLDIDKYYHSIKKLSNSDKYRETYLKLKHLYNIITRNLEVGVGDQKFVLNHSGCNHTPYDLSVLSLDYDASDYEYIIMGHLSPNYIAEAANMYPNPIPREKFIPNIKLNGLTIEGLYIFNTVHNVIMIDNNDFTNLVTITSN